MRKTAAPNPRTARAAVRMPRAEFDEARLVDPRLLIERDMALIERSAAELCAMADIPRMSDAPPAPKTDELPAAAVPQAFKRAAISMPSPLPASQGWHHALRTAIVTAATLIPL